MKWLRGRRSCGRCRPRSRGRRVGRLRVPRIESVHERPRVLVAIHSESDADDPDKVGDPFAAVALPAEVRIDRDGIVRDRAFGEPASNLNDSELAKILPEQSPAR